MGDGCNGNFGGTIFFFDTQYDNAGTHLTAIFGTIVIFMPPEIRIGNNKTRNRLGKEQRKPLRRIDHECLIKVRIFSRHFRGPNGFDILIAEHFYR